MLKPLIDYVEVGKTVSVTLITKLVISGPTANFILWFETMSLWREKPF